VLKRRIFILAIWIFVVLFCSLPAFAQVDTAWVRTYNGLGNSTDEAFDIAVNGSGNVYVTGWSVGSGSDMDYLTIKYYPDGDTAWVRRYNGPANGFDQAWALALHGSNNVYVVGSALGNGSRSDFTTVKYNADGDTIWTRTYNGPGNGGLASTLVVDVSGNAYVAGLTTGIGTESDYTIIKYYPNGDTAWLRRYNGPGNENDWATAIAVDDSSNVYVTGYRDASQYGEGGDYATIKYYPNGDTAWLRTYNGPGDSTDHAWGIAMDDSGNIYVAGYSFGVGTGLDYATIKYNPDGDTVWVRRYNGPANTNDVVNAIAVDGSGNAYVTGGPATIKYYPNGDTAWVRVHGGPEGYLTDCLGLGVDDSGCVYVTGGIFVDETDQDYCTAKYYPDGDTAWVRRYSGPGRDSDWANALALDDSGNVYVTGRIGFFTGTYGDYGTIKYWPNFAPAVFAPDSFEFLCEPDTIRFTVTATDPDTDDTLTLSGPGILTPIKGVSPLVANVQIYVSSGGTRDYVYTVIDTRNGSDSDTSTWSISVNNPPAVTAPDSSKLLCGPDTVMFTVTATDPDVGDTLTLTGPGIPAPIRGVSPLSVDPRIYVASAETYDFIYTVTDTCEVPDADTATWSISFNSAPGFFSLLFPVDSGFVLPVVTFDWENSIDPDPRQEVRYDLYVSTSSAFHPDSTNIYDSLLTSGYTDSLGIGGYFWKVKAYDSCEETWSTQTWSFYVFVRGDADGDGLVDIEDVVYLIHYLYINGPSPVPVLQVVDVNCDGVIDLGDVLYIINYVLKDGPPPCGT